MKGAGRVLFVLLASFASCLAADSLMTTVCVVFKSSGKPAHGVTVEVFDTTPDKDKKQPLFAGRTENNGCCDVPGTDLDASATYYFTVRRAGYGRAYRAKQPGGEIRLELMKMYGPPIPED